MLGFGQGPVTSRHDDLKEEGKVVFLLLLELLPSSIEVFEARKGLDIGAKELVGDLDLE